jgi:hypothetical protein
MGRGGGTEGSFTKRKPKRKIPDPHRSEVVGKNWTLFAGSHESAEIIAQIYSFMAAYKVHGVNPSEWLADVLVRLPATKPSQYPELFPSNWTLTVDRNEGLSEEFFLDDVAWESAKGGE